jgi:hypothetical protein
MSVEKVILENLIFNETYARKVIPFLKEEYFHDGADKVVFNLINDYVKKYNVFPIKQELFIDLSKKDNISEITFNNSKEIIENMEVNKTKNLDWLVNQTEIFCQEKSVYNAIMASIQILDDKTGKIAKGSIPQILSDALAVSFDTHIGHDLIEDAESRYNFYHTNEVKIPFDLEYFNKITQGGLSKKTLNIALAGCVHPDTKIKIRFRKKE